MRHKAVATAAAAGGGGFAPTDIAGCEFWVDASNAGSITGSPTVTAWNDLSGNARHLTGAGTPTTGSATINSLNAIDFNGTTDYFYRTTAFWNALGPSTAFVVGEVDVNGGSWISEGSTSTSTQLFALYTVSDGYSPFFRNDANTTQAQLSFAGGSLAAGGPFYAAYIDDGTNLIGKTDGVAGTTRTSTSFVTYTLNRFAVGANVRNTVNGYHNGRIAEVIIYDGDIGDTDIATVESYLATKWAI